MSEPNSESSPCRWDVGFFVRGISHENRLGTTYLRMASFDTSSKFVLKCLAEKYAAFADFIQNPGLHEIQLVCIRVNASSETEAIKKAWRILGHLIDCYTVVLDHFPSVAPILLLRKEADRDAQLREYSEKFWASWGPPELKTQWEARSTAVLRRWFPFYEKVLDKIEEPHTPLEDQLMHSFRLFRLGVESHSFGIEFLCKFIALEGLIVVQGEKKRERLEYRLSRLLRFATWDVKDIVNKLWKERNHIVHEARTEYFTKDTDSSRYVILIPSLETIATAVFVFAADNLSKAATVRELWEFVETYDPPQEIKQERPVQLPRAIGISSVLDRGTIIGVGAWFDPLFATPLNTGTTTIDMKAALSNQAEDNKSIKSNTDFPS